MVLIRRVIKKIYSAYLRNQIAHSKHVYIMENVSGWKNVNFEGRNSVGREAIFSGTVEVGFGTTVGPYDVIAGPVTIGPYCQLGQFVGIFGENHPVSFLSTYINRNLFDGRLRPNMTVRPVSIGADVWIGHGAVILKGVHVGNGAIIGANAVVTKNVPAYSIVGGNPAKVIRYRFSPEIITLLEKFQWWKLEPEELAAMEFLFQIDFNTNPEEGLEQIHKVIEEKKLAI